MIKYFITVQSLSSQNLRSNKIQIAKVQNIIPNTKSLRQLDSQLGTRRPKIVNLSFSVHFTSFAQLLMNHCINPAVCSRSLHSVCSAFISIKSNHRVCYPRHVEPVCLIYLPVELALFSSENLITWLREIISGYVLYRLSRIATYRSRFVTALFAYRSQNTL